LTENRLSFSLNCFPVIWREKERKGNQSIETNKNRKTNVNGEKRNKKKH
jgi:hypothetical protein